MEVGRAHFTTSVNRYTILDAPGHKNYVPNMIAGAAQADVGILVISARRGKELCVAWLFMFGMCVLECAFVGMRLELACVASP